MRVKKDPYELAESQVSTPHNVIGLFWNLLRSEAHDLSNVLDLGAGDGRFAARQNYRRYTGIEIDARAAKNAVLAKNASIQIGCAFEHDKEGYDACIGNPPYVRHHDIESPWKEKIRSQLQQQMGFPIDLHGNLYLYFLCLALLKTHSEGIVGLIIPFEWVSRPSARRIRNYIKERNWDVKVYRFQSCIFKDVLTTASITIVNKRRRKSHWTFKNISPQLRVVSRSGETGSGKAVLPHSNRGSVWAIRGMSPGSQKVFTLTEGERVHHGLTLRDVVPCATSFRHVPKAIRILDKKTFKQYFVEAGLRCWLIKSRSPKLSPRLQKYLKFVPLNERNTYTCLNQNPWYAYEDFPAPALMIHSAFTKFGPKVILNRISAKAIGSIYGIHSIQKQRFVELQQFLLDFDFESQIVSHSKVLKKIEVKQLNGVLKRWSGELGGP